MNKKNNYLSVIYNEKDKPLTNYPNKLTNYLFQKYNLKKTMKLLDVGCGRGEFLQGFINCGLKGYGLDQFDTAKKYSPKALIKVINLEKEKFPYVDNTFDVVFSKSVLEHFYRPEEIIKEFYRVLKPNGIIITMCPDWYYNYRIYFEDFTHRTPFMKSSLRDLKLMSGFKDVEVKYFRQLPIIWNYPILTIISELTRVLTPNFLKRYNKWIRFSKEIMLLSSARKP